MNGLTPVWRGLALVAVAICLMAPTANPAQPLTPAACAQLRRQVEAELVAAQRCQASDECVVTAFEYAFAPCGTSARRGAALDKAAADAKRYQDQCNPVLHPVKCRHLPRAICERGRCLLAPPEEPATSSPPVTPARMTAAEVAAANERTIATLFDGLPAAPQAWNTIVFHHSATAGGSKARFDDGHRRKFNDPDGMEYHFLIGSGVGSPDGLIEIGDHWRKQLIAYHLFTRARDAGSIAICLVGNFELPGRTPTPAQRAAVTALARALAARFGIAIDAMTTHHQIDGRLTQCPGKNFPLTGIKAALQETRAR